MNNDVKIMDIRDIVHAAKLLKILRLKESLIQQQLEYVRNYLKEKS